ncbi:MAG: hypothetical protein HY885_10400 [Deltaproteobacteria bacterium]|nr:hypothetical protein [Deltaproteobacteria bacterium]
MTQNPLETFIKQLRPSAWPDIQQFILAGCRQSLQKTDSGQSRRTALILPAIAGISHSFISKSSKDYLIREFAPGGSWLQKEDLADKTARVILPLAFLYTWDTDALWQWLVRNCREGAELEVILPNFSYLPLLLELNKGRFPVAGNGMQGPVKEVREWQNYFQGKGCVNISLQWRPAACFVKEPPAHMDENLLLSPCYSLTMNLPAGD